MVVPNLSDVINYIEQLKIRLNESIFKNINYNKLYLDSIKNSFVIKNPLIMYENKKQRLDIILDKINNLVTNKIENYKIKIQYIKNTYVLTNPDNLYKNSTIKLNNIIDKLELLNPLSILKRGYTVTYKNDKIIASIKDLDISDVLKIKFVDGEIDVSVKRIGE